MKPAPRGRLWRGLAVGLLLAGCSGPVVHGGGPPVAPPRLETAALIAADGTRLPMTVWPAPVPEAAMLALHGFNDYRASFEEAAEYWAERGITTYAYDQRGFGETAAAGVWGGHRAMAADARAALALIGERHPGLPVYLLGVSMGGAVALLALADPAAPPVDGLILSAPAVWGARAMNPFYRAGLWLWAHLAPGSIVTGRGLGRLASDNIQMLLALGRDPLVIKATRIDAIYGLTQLMGAGLEAADRVAAPTLLLFGARDEVVPVSAVAEVARALPPTRRLVLYRDGWHMLLRDCQAPTVWRDIAAWIEEPEAPLPSGAEVADAEGLATLPRGPVFERCPGTPPRTGPTTAAREPAGAAKSAR